MTTDDALKLLGLAREASPEDIRRAYTRLVQQYHPDKVQHLGVEFQQMAERKTKEINEAHALLKNYRREEVASSPPPPSSSPHPPQRQPRRPRAEPTPPATSAPLELGLKGIAIVGAVLVLLLSIRFYVNNGGRQSSRAPDVPAIPLSPSSGNPAPTTRRHGYVFDPISHIWAPLRLCGGESGFSIGDWEGDVLRILGPPERTEYPVFVVDSSQSKAYTYGMVYSGITVFIKVIGDSKYVAGWWFQPSQAPPKCLEWCGSGYNKPRYFGKYSPLSDVMALEGLPYYALAEFDKRRGGNKLYLRYKGGSVTIGEYWFVDDYINGRGLHTDERDSRDRLKFMAEEILRRDLERLNR